MNKLQSKHILGLTRAALFAGTALAATPALSQTQLEEVVVTAQKRAQNLQEVPIAVTAITQEGLKANRIVDIRDLNAIAPNVTVKTIQGGGAGALVSVRGLVTAGSALGSDKGLTQYIDGVYLQATAASVFQLADVERIEVLKGPQGTLFGRNATGGAISITTRNPSGEFGIHQELTAGNYSHWRSKTRLDLPQMGIVSASVTYVHSERNGDTKNLGAGAVFDWRAGGAGIRTSPKRLGDEKIDSTALALKFDFSPDFELTYKFDWTENEFTPEPAGLANVTALLAALRSGQGNPALMTPITNKRPDAVNNWLTSPSRAYSSGHNITMRWTVNDNLTIKNILSKRRSGNNSTWQLDGFGGLRVTPLLAAIGATAVGQPFIVLGNTTHQNDRQWSDELQVNWTSKLMDVTAGYIHFDYKVAGGGFPGTPNTIALRTLVNGVALSTGYRETRVHVTSDAAYAQVEGHVTSRLDLVAGYRITRDKKVGVDNSAQDATGTSITLPIAYEKSRPTYLVGVNFKPTDDILLYAKYTTGFISGGQLASRTYGPETAESYEAGVKADLLGSRLRSNLAVFHVKYGNLQFQTSGLNVFPPINASVVLVNAGDAKAKGFEWENTLLPMEGLTLTANVGYTDFKYTRIDPVIGTLTSRDDPRYYLVAARPKWTGSGSVQYDTPEIFAGGHLSFRADANFRGGHRIASTNTVPIQSVTQVGDSWIVNARVALADFDLANGKATLAVWGRNLTDNKQLVNSTPVQFGALGTIVGAMYERARTYGVDLTFDF
jgi:iron complex outermembrane receptor protein